MVTLKARGRNSRQGYSSLINDSGKSANLERVGLMTWVESTTRQPEIHQLPRLVETRITVGLFVRSRDFVDRLLCPQKAIHEIETNTNKPCTSTFDTVSAVGGIQLYLCVSVSLWCGFSRYLTTTTTRHREHKGSTRRAIAVDPLRAYTC